jgi:hypothetical protein
MENHLRRDLVRNPRSSKEEEEEEEENPCSYSEEEEEIKIPKSRNSSTYPAPPLLQNTPYTSTIDQLHRERAVTRRIFQALPTQTDRHCCFNI